MKKRLSKSLRKFIRREKARMRGEFSGTESDRKIKEMMTKMNPTFGQKADTVPLKPEAKKVPEKKATEKEPKANLKHKPKPAAAKKSQSGAKKDK